MRQRRAKLHPWLAIALVWTVTGCQTRAPTSPTVDPGRREAGARQPTADDLASHRLYTFSEAELDRYLRTIRDLKPELTRRIVHLGRQNLGQPYEIYLLGEFPYEFYDPDPIYCLSRSDCLTFCEHVYAMALSHDWWSFLRTLQRIRYRDGIIGMLSRNHYTIADWNRNNAFLLEDLTTRLGNGRVCAPLEQVCRRARFFAKFGIGQDIPDEPISAHYIPKENLPHVLHELRDGDFVNIIRGNDESQWCGHTGMIAVGDNGTVNLLHSARPAVREQPLIGYLTGDRRCLGIKILRLRAGAEEIVESVLATSPDATEVSEAVLTAALAASPLMSTGAPPSYAGKWSHAMRLQSYRLPPDAPLDAELQTALESIDQRIGEELGIPPADRAFGVLDLTDLHLAMIQPDVMFYAASVPKICIVMAYFATHPEAVADLDPEVERELQHVIKRSDNQLAAKYSQMVGLDTIQEMLQSKRYRFYDQEHGGGFWCGKHYGIAQPRLADPVHDHSHAATVRQCLRYYLMLEQGRLVSAAACARLKRIFAAPDLEFHNQSFVLGLNGRDLTIIRKSGMWEDWHLDTARIQHGERVYLLAGMVRHPMGREYLAQMATAVDEALCGPPQPKPFSHQVIMHAAAENFHTGTFERAWLTEDGSGVTLACSPGGEIAVYESPVIEPGMKFNEALLSWNVDTPVDAGFCVEIRVGHRWDDSWSPYLYVGQWGAALPSGERVTTCDEGRIDVDYFHSDQRFDRLQYRIRAACQGSEDRNLRVDRVAVCVSDLTGIPPAVMQPPIAFDPLPAAAWQRRLPIPFRSQATDNPDLSGRLCGPASVAMVLAYRGVEHPTEDVAAVCFDPVHGIYGNWPRSIQAAYSLGVPGYLTRFSDWSDVERMIAADQPLVISIRVEEDGGLTDAPYKSTEGHLLVLTGFDSEGNVAVNDPAVRTAEKGCLTYSRRDLEEVWMRGSGGMTYVLLPRQ